MNVYEINDQRGSIHVVIISVLTISLIGAIGYIFWSNFVQAGPDSSKAVPIA